MPELEFGGAAELSTSPLARATATVPGVTSPLTSLSPRPSQYSINIDAGAHPAGARVKRTPANRASICSQTITPRACRRAPRRRW